MNILQENMFNKFTVIIFNSFLLAKYLKVVINTPKNYFFWHSEQSKSDDHYNTISHL